MKSPAIDELLAILEARLGKDAFRVVDHWNADLHAIGVASVADERHLAYVSTFGLPAGTYDIECEAPSADPCGYRVVSRAKNANVEELLAIVHHHLSGLGQP